jgi:hypothetical protein
MPETTATSSPAAIHFDILESLNEENSDIDTRIRAATYKAFMSMKAISFDKKIDLRTRKKFCVQIPMNIALKRCVLYRQAYNSSPQIFYDSL